MSEPKRLRKSLSALAGTDERKGYFYCLKLLGVLPPPPGSKLNQWFYYTPAGAIDYHPKCLHDVLISIHATSCEHGSIYFSFYHRHMMILTEIFLTYAHKILSGKVKLSDAYPPKDYPFLYNESNKGLWETVFNTYRNFKGIPADIISNHYWNPTNYENDADMIIPEELDINPHTTNPIDILFQNINKCYPWQIHVPRRWFESEEKYNQQAINTYIFRQKQKGYNPNQYLYLQGQLDPRKNQSVYDSDSTTAGLQFISSWDTQHNLQIRRRNFQNYDFLGKKNLLLNSISASESLASYSAKSKNLQYIKKNQQRIYGLSSTYARNYNNRTPHFSYAQALFKDSFITFLAGQNGENQTGQSSHNILHNNFKYMLRDATFSVTSLVFWPYHSWIDAQVQFKIRRSKQEDKHKKTNTNYVSIKQYLDRTFISDIAFGPVIGNALFKQVSKDMQSMANWKISGDEKIPPETGGIYPILEWITPGIKKIFNRSQTNYTGLSAAFCARDYILTKTHIRDSYQLNQIYRNYYAVYYKDRFAFFDKDYGITKFDFNFNYQIGHKSTDINNVLDQKGQNLPSYLQNLKHYWDEQTNSRKSSLRTASSFAVQSRPQHLKDPQFEQSQNLNVRKLFSAGIGYIATYPSDTKNGRYDINVSLKNVIVDLHQKLKINELKELEDFVKRGINVSEKIIFGKQQNAVNCHKCKDRKIYFADLDEDLRVRAPKIWKYIHISTLNQVYYETGKQIRLKSISDKLQVVHNPIFTFDRLVVGAQEIQITVTTDIHTKESKFIRIDAESYSVVNDTVRNILTKKYYSFTTNFDFYKIFDVNKQTSDSFFDRYVYKVLKGWISVGGQRTKFEVRIPGFQRFLRLNLHISRTEGEIYIKLIDPDFKTKTVFYDSLIIIEDQ